MTDAVSRVNAMTKDAFVEAFGPIYECSPWIADAAFAQAPFADTAAVAAALRGVIAAAPDEAKLALVREHPELARRAGVDTTLTDASRAEQASAGLDRLTPVEYARFNALNDAYRARFEMPFVICVRLSDKDFILSEMERRGANTPAEELATALGEIDKIAALRCAEVFRRLEEPS
ncbi:hypothetical protein AA23498_3136 [Acetobacter nitrogenifigens DSM 23921 = NBRC 105050]|uniref:2-oxo-4-hydroxy-4-carboxy-5-ureidoimidazoline decarboxylase n=1 Tax=Acetobacter nitrogenifigens DSM 23921 = NBRC 105050 TaxID=1120919 RepID=A0A511X5E7_9PROT|nr:2-oxo-4-hydroxy-4-carboxy-5-ureidoimidazoline decarboxylase [Acetobacter nitrogenifigens]GBQ98192.1 hypothetical protein AA23498_3136 [Acetobacter nitrogenifigens DSM 23921 = NBRC 105050]GEN58187.1 OHCU decarboxylase [Acetobacter nitrogenifigens DSM 23921 = NBRC 105050]